jgi:hypothetical protein
MVGAALPCVEMSWTLICEGFRIFLIKEVVAIQIIYRRYAGLW